MNNDLLTVPHIKCDWCNGDIIYNQAMNSHIMKKWNLIGNMHWECAIEAMVYDRIKSSSLNINER